MFKWAQRALVKPTATPSVLPARSGLAGVRVCCFRLLSSSLFWRRRFLFLVCARLQQRHQHPRSPGRASIAYCPLPIAHCSFCYYCTAAWKPFASCFIAVPCDWLAVCACACAIAVCLSVCTSLRDPPCLPVSEVLATCYLLLLLLLPLRYLSDSAKPYPPAYPSTTPPSQPYPGLSRRLPASHPSQQTQTLSKLSPIRLPLGRSSLPCFASPGFLPWRSPGLSSSFAWHTAASHSMRSCLGNHLSTTPAGPEEIARLGRVRPTMRRANRVPVA